MKQITILLTMGLFCQAAWSQKIIEKNFTNVGSKSVAMNIQIADNINIATWNKNEVSIKASVNINDNRNNDDYIWNFSDSAGSINVKSKFRENIRTQWDSNHNYHNDISVTVYIPENVKFSVETINGNIEIRGNVTELRAHTISGFVDLSLPPQQKADLRLSTITGTIFTDLPLIASNKSSSSTNISEKFNGGGNGVDLRSISGNIFLRKK